MGAGYSGERLQNSISAAPPSLFWGSDDHGQRPSSGRSFKQRDFNPSGEGGCREGKLRRTACWVLLQIFHHSKKRRRSASYPGPKASKRICKSATVQNAEHTADFNVRRERRVVHVPGLEGRILSRPHVPSPQTFSEVCIPRTGLPVQGAALWPVSLAKSFYKGGGSGPVPPSSSRLEDPALLGRLANLCPRSCPSHERHRESNSSRTELRAQDESGEEQPHPHTEYNVCGATIKFSHNAWLAYPTEGVQAPSAGEPVPSWQTTGVGAISEVAGHNVSSSCSGPTRPPQGSAAAEVVECVQPSSSARPACETQGHTAIQARTTPLERPGPLISGGPTGEYPIPQGGCDHRRLPNWMGCSLGRQDSSGYMEFPLEGRAYKCAGAEGSSSCPSGTSPPYQGQTCPSAVGQLLRCVPHKSPRGHQVSARPPGSLETPGVGPHPSGIPESSVHSGSAEPSGRPPVQDWPTRGRVETAPGCGSSAVVSVRQSSSRPVCIIRDNSLRQVVFHKGPMGTSGSGCSVPRLAVGPAICFPSSSPDPLCPPQDPHRPLQGLADSSQVAGEMVVPRSPPPGSGAAMAPSSQGRSPVSGRRSDLAPQSSTSTAVGMATPQPLLQELGEAVMHTIQSARAPSTQACYRQKWGVFSDWCHNKQLDPVICSVHSILGFLQSLLDLGRASSTVKVHAAAISSFHQPVDGQAVGKHPLVSQFIKGARRLRPGRALRAPSWDLATVLHSLTLAPYEPLDQADLKFLTQKTVFLLAICSAKRVSELHALSVSEQCLRWKAEYSGVSLWPNPSFLPKVVNPQTVNQVIEISSFHPESAPTGDNLGNLCPIRALRTYVTRTQSLRHTHSQLFVCYGGVKRGNPVSKQRLSHWVVDAIAQAYDSQSLPVPGNLVAHSTRSMATSWAALRGVSVAEICAAASWSAPCTFARFYRVNVAAPAPLSEAVLSVARRL